MPEITETVSLSPFERWSLIMQAKARRDGATDDCAKADMEAVIACLEHGYESWYPRFLGVLCEPFSAAKSKFVDDLLSFYLVLERFLRENEEHRTSIEGKSWSKFRGFGGNDEPDYHFYVQWLIEHTDGYSELREPGVELDPHMPTLHVYGPIVEEYRSRRSKSGGRLELDDFNAILDTAKLGETAIL